MTPDGFRKLVLRLPGAVEKEHMNHPDFRVGGKIFATIHPDGIHGVVMLTPRQQRDFRRVDRKAFVPLPGAWGRMGIKVLLKAAKPAVVGKALKLAWLNTSG